MADELYKDLGVDKNASQDEIKRAYRQQSKIHHPDKGGDVERFKRISGAHHILGDASRRKKYDETGETKVVDARQEKKSAIMQAIIDQKSKEFVLSPLQKLVGFEEKIHDKRNALKAKMESVQEDIDKLSKSKKSKDLATVLGMLVSIRNAMGDRHKEAEMEFELCGELIQEFKIACKVLKRKPGEVTGWVQQYGGGDQTTSSTGGY